MVAEFQRDTLLPFQSHYLTIDGLRLHYFDEGPPRPASGTGHSPPVVILLHGNPTWSFYYRNLITALRQSFRVIAPDLIGFGLSDKPRDVHFRAHDRVEHLERLIEHLGLSSFSLVMHDWGGPIGSSLAVRRPERIERLVYFNTTLTETESLPSFIKFAASPLVGRFLLKNTTHFVRLLTEFGVTRLLPREIKAGYYFPFRSRKERAAIWDFVADIPFSSQHPTYSELIEMAGKLPSLRHIPVLIVWGLKDPCFHRAMLHQVAKHFPQAEVMEIPDASHLVLEDAPEECCRTVSRFLLNQVAGPGKPTLATQVDEGAKCDDRKKEVHALYAKFQAYAEAHPSAHAVIVPQVHHELFGIFGIRGAEGASISHIHCSVGSLLSLVRQYERGLSDLGLRPDDKVLMLVSPGVDFLALSFAVMGRGAVPVFVDPGMGLENLSRCIEDTRPDVFIGVPKAQLLRIVQGELLKKIRLKLTVTNWSFGVRHTTGSLKRFSSTPLPSVEVRQDAPALIAFTSGATGSPKGVIFTNAMLERQTKIFAEIFGFRGGKKDLPLLPIFSLFSLPLGVCSVFPPMDTARPLDLSPQLIVKAIHDLGISYSFGSPTLWNKIAEYCIRHEISLPSIERLFMAGAPVGGAVISNVTRVCPQAQVCTPYGATEALPVTLAPLPECGDRSGKVKAKGGDVGTPIGAPIDGLSARIIKSVNGPILHFEDTVPCEPFEIGEIIVSGKHVSPGYTHRPEADTLAKIADGESFWHRMGDMGYADEEGKLYFCGRKAHAVFCEERPFFSDPVEFVFNQHRKVKRSALIGLFSGKIPAVAIEPFPEYFPQTVEDREAFGTELRALAQTSSVTAGIERFFFHPNFPVDARHNAKIFRDKLGVWATERCLCEEGGESSADAEPQAA